MQQKVRFYRLEVKVKRNTFILASTMKTQIQYLFTGGLLAVALLSMLAGCKKEEFPQPKAKEAFATINGEKIKFPNGYWDIISANSGSGGGFVLTLLTDKYQPFHTGKTLFSLDINFRYPEKLPVDSIIYLTGQWIYSSGQTNDIYATQYADGDIQEMCDHYIIDTLAQNWVKITSYDTESKLLCGEFGCTLEAKQYICQDFPERLEIANGTFCVYQ